MSTELAQLFPLLRDLTRAEKLHVIQFLIAELLQEEKAGAAYAVWSPYAAFDGADAMLKALAEKKDK